MIQRWTQPLVPQPQALAADGKRIRGANRLTAEGLHWETVTLVEHVTGLPLASRSYREEGGEQGALRALLEEVDLRGRTVTLDAGHAGQEIQRAIIEQHGGQVLVRIKGNCPQTWATLTELNWELGAERSWQEKRWQRSRNKHWERRSIEVFTPHPKLLPYPHAKQAYRIQHETCQRPGSPVSISYSYGITSLAEQAASAQDLLALQRGHWQVESANHYRRDVSLGEDASRIRTGHGPSNAAALNNLALALLLSQRQTTRCRTRKRTTRATVTRRCNCCCIPVSADAAPQPRSQVRHGMADGPPAPNCGWRCSLLGVAPSQRFQHRNKIRFSAAIRHSFRVPTSDFPPYPPSNRLRISGGHSARVGGLTAAGERVPALRARPVGGQDVAANGNPGRDDHRAVRR